MIVDGRQQGTTLAEIREDHLARYRWAAAYLRGQKLKGPVADLGCGCGYGSYILAQAGLPVRAVEQDGDAVKFAEENWRHLHVDFIEADATTWDTTDCGALVAFEIIEHIKDGPGALAKWKAPLLLGSVPNESVIPFDSPTTHSEHFRHYTVPQLAEALAAGGWRIEKLGGQQGKTGTAAAIDWMNPGARTLVFAARR